MTATEILTSIDRQIADLRNEYESTIKSLNFELVQAKADAVAARSMLEREAAKATTAVQMAATLVAHFGAVSKIFEDARTVADKAKSIFAELEPKAKLVETQVVKEVESVASGAVNAVEAALHTHMENTNVQT